ncbi:MAG: 3-hydroxyacyl-CoA dehydrogenase family protein, partial [Tumebacillaceae bacterium]
RLIMPLINDAVAILAEGVASAVDIDQAMTIGFGFALGPLELADRFGLDRVLGILHALFHETGELRYRPHAHLRKLVRAGRCGIKTREGFFRYDEWGERIAEREKE